MAPSRLIHVALAASAALVVAGAALFWHASRTATGPERGVLHSVTVGDTCDPADFTIPAGRTTFTITNASDRPLEWEILDGVMVVAERENIAPGFKSELTVKLRPGSFEITCGLLSNPRGRLVVTPSAQSEAERAAPPVTAFIGPLSEYKVYLVTQSAQLLKAVAALDQAVAAGNAEDARAALLAARLPYKRMEAVTGRIADLENTIDPLPEYLEKREADPAFTGFHRIEYGLWGQGGTEGLAPVSARLLADVTVLKDRLRALALQPADLATSAAVQADRLAHAAPEDRWSGADAADAAAALEGVAKLSQILDPLVRNADAGLADRIASALGAADHGALAEALAEVNAAIGLDR